MAESQPQDGMLAQILLKQGEMGTQLAVIDQKVTALATGLNDHETRIRALEGVKAKLIGGATAAGLLSGGLATLIYWVLSHH